MDTHSFRIYMSSHPQEYLYAFAHDLDVDINTMPHFIDQDTFIPTALYTTTS